MLHTDITLTVDSLASSGDGIGRTSASADAKAGRRTGGRPGSPWNRGPHKKAGSRVAGGGVDGDGGRVVFVPGTVPGDTVRVRVVGERKRFLVGRLLEVLSPGPDRVAPRCPYFGRCGGCDWQHLEHAAQLAVKERQLADTLVRVGGLPDASVRPIVAGDSPWTYRNRIQGEIRDGRYHQRERGTGDLVAIDRCEIADEAINDRLALGFADQPPGRVELALDGADVRVLPVGDDHSTELGFRQVNVDVEARLIALLAEEVVATPAERVIDLYCGRGTWTCLLAERCPERQLLGVDVDPDNIRAAQAAKRARGLGNVEFRQGRVERQLGRLRLANAACIVDPPRAGLDRQIIDALNADPVRRLWYVSCHPATLARDLSLLCAGVYRIDSVQPLDMFPQTAHLECLVGLSAAS